VLPQRLVAALFQSTARPSDSTGSNADMSIGTFIHIGRVPVVSAMLVKTLAFLWAHPLPPCRAHFQRRGLRRA